MGSPVSSLLFDIGRVARGRHIRISRRIKGGARHGVNTEHYTYQELNNEINGNTGGISAGLSMYPKKGENANPGDLRAFGRVCCMRSFHMHIRWPKK